MIVPIIRPGMKLALLALVVAACVADDQTADTALAPLAVGAAAPVGVVTSNADSGPGTLRAVLAACPDLVTFAINDTTIAVTTPVVLSCPNPVTVTGPTSTRTPIVPGSDGRIAGVGRTSIPAVPQPGVTILNRGPGDGLSIRSSNVVINRIAVRGTQAGWVGDIAVRSATNVTLNGVVAGLDDHGLTGPATSDPTGSQLLWVQDSTAVKVNNLAAGYNTKSNGAVVFQNVKSSYLANSIVVGVSWTVGGAANTYDAVTLAYGTSDFTVRGSYVGPSSSSAVEIHMADHITVRDSTFADNQRGGVTIYDGHYITVDRSVIHNAGVCGVVSHDMGGVMTYPNSSTVAITNAQVDTNCAPLLGVV